MLAPDSEHPILVGLRRGLERGMAPARLWPIARNAVARVRRVIEAGVPAEAELVALLGPEPPPSPESPAAGGVGTELEAILASLGVGPDQKCPACKAMKARMDRLGPEGVRRNFNAFVGSLKDRAAQLDWQSKWKAAALALLSGLVVRVNPYDPFPGIVNLAVERAEQKRANGG